METDTVGPAVEFNWGALANVHLHIIVPAAGILPANNPGLAPAGIGPRAFGMGDIELGIKLRFVQESKHRPIIGTFTMFDSDAVLLRPHGHRSNGKLRLLGPLLDLGQ